jgi:hypothetical protein
MKKYASKWRLAGQGIKQLFTSPKYWLPSLIAAVIFVFIFNLLTSGSTFLQLLVHLPFLEKFSVLGQVYADFFVHFFSLEKILILLLSLGQGIITGLIIYIWKSRRNLDDTALLESGGATLIALIGAGCPLCGGTILMPFLMMIFGASAMVFLQTVSIALTLLAFVPILFAIRRLGFLSYTYSTGGKANGK